MRNALGMVSMRRGAGGSSPAASGKTAVASGLLRTDHGVAVRPMALSVAQRFAIGRLYMERACTSPSSIQIA